MKDCKKGEYYCTTRKKCMPIPRGWHVLRSGYLAKDEDTKKKNGNGNGNGNSNGNGNGGNGNGTYSNGSGNGGNGGGNGGGVSEQRQLRIPIHVEIPKNSTEFNLGLMFRESLDENTGMFFQFEETGQKSFHMKDTRIPLDIAFIKEDGTIESIKELKPFTLLPVFSEGDVRYALEVNKGWFLLNSVKVGDNIFASLNEDVSGLEVQNVTDGIKFREYEFIDIVKPEPIQSPKNNIPYTDLSEVRRVPNYDKPGNIIQIYLAWRGANLGIQMFFPGAKKPSRREVQDQMRKVYPNSKLWSYQVIDYDPEQPIFQPSQ